MPYAARASAVCFSARQTVAGVAGYILRKHGWPRVPFVIAFVLCDLVEYNLQLSLRLASIGRLSLWDRPLAMGLAGLVVVTLVWTMRQKVSVPICGSLAILNASMASGSLSSA